LSDDIINQQPPEESGGGIRDPIPTLDEAYDKQRAIRESLIAKYIIAQASEDSLFTSKERARNCLNAYRKRIEKNREWTLPFGFAVGFGSFCFTLSTGTLTTQLLGWSQDIWKVIFLALTGATLFFTLRAIITHLFNPPDLSVECVVNEMESFRPK